MVNATKSNSSNRQPNLHRLKPLILRKRQKPKQQALSPLKKLSPLRTLSLPRQPNAKSLTNHFPIPMIGFS